MLALVNAGANVYARDKDGLTGECLATTNHAQDADCRFEPCRDWRGGFS